MSRSDTPLAGDPDFVRAAQRGDTVAFEQLVDVYRRSLHAYCYRMLGSVHDADDALQETLLAAWRGMRGFERRSSVRTWLFTIATHCCLKLAGGRPRRILSAEFGPARENVHDLGEPVDEAIWLEPYPDWPAAEATPESQYEQRETIELAFVLALQHLKASQRAVLILRDVLQFSAAETAVALDSSVASVNSLLQRARKSIQAHAPQNSQQAELQALGETRLRDLLAAFVAAWEAKDVQAIVSLLAADARFNMPPLPAWFAGREAILRFMVDRAYTSTWVLKPIDANGQLAFAHFRANTPEGPFRPAAINVLSLYDGRIVEMAAFLQAGVHRRFGLPEIISR